MDRFELMRDFLRIVDTGSLSAAARALKTTQPTLSKRLQHLEEVTGARLLQRNTQGIRLTEAGERYYEACRRILSEMDQLESELTGIRRGLRGSLRLNLPVALGERHLTRIALGFQEQHPELRLDLSLTDRVVDLVEEGVDVAVRVGGVANPAVVARRLGAYAFCLVASPEYLKRYGTPRTARELSNHNFLSYGGDDVEHLETPEGPKTIPVRRNLALDNSLALSTALVSGRGIGRIARWVVEDEIQAGRLTVVLPGMAPPPLPVHAVYLPSKYLPEKVRAFVQHLSGEIVQLPGWVPPPSAARHQP
ncbi:MAG: LysR family transcriptional regulator [Myxococcaceae bacterium]